MLLPNFVKHSFGRLGIHDFALVNKLNRVLKYRVPEMGT